MDIVPALLEKIQKSFESALSKDETAKYIRQLIRSGNATYADTNAYAIRVGEILAEAFKKNLSSKVLPDGKMYFNIAERILTPTLKNNQELITAAAVETQTALNNLAGVGLKGIKPKPNNDRIKGFISRISSTEQFDDVAWILDEPVVNFSQSVVDDTIKTNAEFHARAGLNPKIVRTLAGDACAWCQNLVGNYSYPDVPDDVYRRHDRCRCVVTFEAGKGSKSVHTGTEGKRKYVKDKYGGYEKTKEERIRYAEEMEKTKKARAAAARQKRIDTWKRKKAQASR